MNQYLVLMSLYRGWCLQPSVKRVIFGATLSEHSRCLAQLASFTHSHPFGQALFFYALCNTKHLIGNNFIFSMTANKIVKLLLDRTIHNGTRSVIDWPHKDLLADMYIFFLHICTFD